MKKYLKYVFSALLFTAAWLWWNRYVGTISYHEQLQMFLCTGDYFLERMSLPGGLADYLGEFLVNFFFLAQIGAGIIAGLITLIQILSWWLIRRHIGNEEKNSGENFGFALSFIPAIMMWAVLGRPDILMSLPVAVILIQLLLLASYPESLRHLIIIAALPIIYWLVGTTVFGLVIYLSVLYLLRRKWLLASIIPIYIILIVGLSTQYVHYPVYRIFAGLNYFRYPTAIPIQYFLPLIVAALLPFLSLWITRFKAAKCGQWWVLPILFATISPLGFLYIKSSFDPKIHETLEYDYLVRTARWDKIIQKADKKAPDAPMTVVCLNLALQQTGQLPSRQFNYFQNGREGLLQSFSKDFTSPLPTAEAMLRLGMVNAAQEYYFEAQEAIPNYRKSSRITRRLAETNLINGQYDVAAKYLRLLSKTMFYSEWADETLKILGNEDAINRHHFYGEVRKNNYTEDFLISDQEMDMVLGRLLISNPQNRMAYEYLMSYIILQRDLEHFYEYFQLGKDMGYKTPPKIYQEVHALLEAQQKQDSRIAAQYQNSKTWKYLLNN